MIVRARWILPVDRPPIRDGWLVLESGRIDTVGSGPLPGPGVDLGEVALLPGFVNAHTHLELSWLAQRVPPGGSLVAWLRALLAARDAGPGATLDPRAAAARAAQAMRATGTVLVGDITNTLETPDILRREGLGGVIFHELLGFSVVQPKGLVERAWANVDTAASASASVEPREHGLAPAPDLRFAVVAHAPYSVSPELFREVARQRRSTPLALHLAESPEEVEFVHTGSGPIRQLLHDLDVWSDRWVVPRTTPVRYLEQVGYLQPGLLAVHGVYLTDDEIDQLRDAQACVVVCPRSNEWVGAGPPRLSRFYAAGLPVAVGTDSLASTDSLNLFDELAEMRRLAPDVTAASLLESATRVGADALGFGDDYGTLSVGKRAAVTQVDIPAGVADVEEYLVSGVPASAVRPLS